MNERDELYLGPVWNTILELNKVRITHFVQGKEEKIHVGPLLLQQQTVGDSVRMFAVPEKGGPYGNMESGLPPRLNVKLQHDTVFYFEKKLIAPDKKGISCVRTSRDGKPIVRFSFLGINDKERGLQKFSVYANCNSGNELSHNLDELQFMVSRGSFHFAVSNLRSIHQPCSI